IRGTAYFEYLYAVESRSKILSNDGVKIIEERHFGKVHENLFVSRYELGIEIPERIDTLLGLLSHVPGKVGVVATVGKTVGRIVNNVRLPVKKEWVDSARQSGLFTKLPQLDPQRLESELRMFSQGTENQLLE